MENRKRESTPSIDRLREAFSYDDLTGKLVWRITSSNRRSKGAEAGCPDGQGYRVVMIDKYFTRTHRVVWAYCKGRWPDGFIDHINGDRSDNRICNLRDVSNAVNLQNNSRPQKNNTSGFRGVWFDKKGSVYVAEMSKDGKKHLIGRFLTAEQASAAYIQAKQSSGALPLRREAV